MPLYFAYGSNMDRDTMAVRCPASRPLGVGRLARHRFVIMREGYASVVRDPGRSVWGLVWDLALADMPALDRYEGVGGGLYVKVQQAVISQQGPRRVLVYVGRNAGPGRPLPGYMQGVVAAARLAALPVGYLGELETWLPAGMARHALRAKSEPQDLRPGRRPVISPTRMSPLDAVADPNASWTWKP